MILEDLKSFDIVELANKKAYIVCEIEGDKGFVDFVTGKTMSFDEYDDDLMHFENSSLDIDIVKRASKISKLKKPQVIWEREEDLEICPFCGNEVKVINKEKDGYVVPKIFCEVCKTTMEIEDDSPFFDEEENYEYLLQKLKRAWNKRDIGEKTIYI